MTEHSGLRIEETLDEVGDSKERAIHQRWTMLEEMENHMSIKLGITPLPEPEFPVPEVTKKLLTLEDGKAYSEGYLELNAWYCYVIQLKADCDASLICIEAEMKELESSVRESCRKSSRRTTAAGDAKPPPVAELNDKVARHPRHLELARDKAWYQGLAKKLDARAKGLETGLALMSRQVTIRGQELEQGGRSGSIAGRGGIPNQGMRVPRT